MTPAHRAILQPLITGSILVALFTAWKYLDYRCSCRLRQAREDKQAYESYIAMAVTSGAFVVPLTVVPPEAPAGDGSPDSIASLTTQKITMFAAFVALMIVLALVDAYAFETGAVATFSQCFLGINTRLPFMPFVVAFWMGVLLFHISLARNPGVIPDPRWWLYAMGWTPVFWAGIYVGYKYLYQLPGVD